MVAIRDTASGRLIRKVKAAGDPEYVDFLDEGKTLLLQGHGKTNNRGGIAVVNAADGRERFRFAWRYPTLIGMAFNPNPPAPRLQLHCAGAGSLFTQDPVGMVHWDLATGKVRSEWSIPCTALALASDGKRAVIARGSRWHWCDTRLQPVRPCTDLTESPSLHFFRDGSLLTTDGSWYGGSANLWDPITGHLVQRTQTHAVPLDSITRTPKGKDPWRKLLVYHCEKEVLIWDRVADRAVCRLAGIAPIQDWADMIEPVFSDDSKRVLAAGHRREAGLVRWFDSRTGAELGRYRVPRGKLYPGMERWAEWYSDDGTLFGYIMPDSRLALVDCRRGEVCQVLGIPMPPPRADDRDSLPPWKYERVAGDALILASREDEAVAGQKEFAVWLARPAGAFAASRCAPRPLLANWIKSAACPSGGRPPCLRTAASLRWTMIGARRSRSTKPPRRGRAVSCKRTATQPAETSHLPPTAKRWPPAATTRAC